MKTIHITYWLAILFLAFVTCEKMEWNNPFDPDCPKETWTPNDFGVAQEGDVIKLTWNQSETNISGFKIERKVGDGTWEMIGSLGKTTLTWTDSGLTDGLKHEYRLFAYAGDNESNPVTASETPVLSKGTFTDSRDERVYKWVRIGTQKWMAENLKYRYSDYFLSSNRINGSDNASNQLKTGTILVYQTNQGRSGKMQIQEYGYNLIIKWVTYNFDGSIFSSGTNLTIRGTFHCDLDNGTETNVGSEFWWNQVTSTERYLTPENNAVFAIYTYTTDFGNVKVNNGIYIYENNPAYFETYGCLYNWYTATSGNICPDGWHLPSDEEWKELEMYLGMSLSEADKDRWRGTDEGGKLKEIGYEHWNDPNTDATNIIGFTALPGGRLKNGYIYLGRNALFWSSSEYRGYAWSRELGFDYGSVFRNMNNNIDGQSVRCVRDQ